jgi:putative nucleotidyltransferase with HDIG domain
MSGEIAVELVDSGRALLEAAAVTRAPYALVELGVGGGSPAWIAQRLARDRDRTVLVAGPGSDPGTSHAARMGGVRALWLPCSPERLRAVLALRRAEPHHVTAAPETNVAVSTAWQALRGAADALAAGRPVDAGEVAGAAAQLAALADSSGLRQILDLLRSHHDPTYAHSIRVAAGLTLFGTQVGVSEADRQLLAMAGILHDLGKIAVPQAVLSKPGKLDSGERSLVRRHPGIGEDMLRRSDGIPNPVIEVAARHHERLDGTGYPRGLDGRHIDDLSRLAAVVDVHVALTEPRAYKTAHSDEAAFALMLRADLHGLEPSYLERYRQMILDTRPGLRAA